MKKVIATAKSMSTTTNTVESVKKRDVAAVADVKAITNTLDIIIVNLNMMGIFTYHMGIKYLYY
jgi:hypothetical protein